jgi:inosine-uridine nucleoside N-ribohydrolase
VPPILIDTDPGLDDALALLYAWADPDARVVAVTTVAGNVPLDIATTNLLRLLALRRPSPPPRVAAGADRPLLRPPVTAVRYHGADGLGDVGGWDAVDTGRVPREAVEVIVETARGAASDFVLVTLGPLTNLALAQERDGAALRGIRRVVAMGGAVDVPGNVTPTAEFNLHADPEAAARVLRANLPLDLVPLDATRQAVVTRAVLEAALADRPGPLAERIARFTTRGFRLDGERGSPGMILHDPLAVAVALDASLVEWERVRLEIGPDGETRRTAGAPNCRFARRVDTERFLPRFLDRVCRGA